LALVRTPMRPWIQKLFLRRVPALWIHRSVPHVGHLDIQGWSVLIVSGIAVLMVVLGAAALISLLSQLRRSLGLSRCPLPTGLSGLALLLNICGNWSALSMKRILSRCIASLLLVRRDLALLLAGEAKTETPAHGSLGEVWVAVRRINPPSVHRSRGGWACRDWRLDPTLVNTQGVL
jgi:hypothetical protein